MGEETAAHCLCSPFTCDTMGRQPATMPPFTTFEECVKFVQEWDAGKGTSNDDKLEAYGLYKQATVGDVNTDRPGMLNFSGKSKWDAWKAREGTSSEDAQATYIQTITAQFEKYGA